MAELTPFLISILIALAGGMFRGFAGFGGGLLMAPLLTLIHRPEDVVPALIVIGLVGDCRLLPEVWREVDFQRVKWVAGPAFIGLPVGIFALATLDSDVVRPFLNCVVLVLVILLGRGIQFRRAERPIVLAPAGLISGILTGIGGIGGPPVVLTFLSINEPAAKTRANMIAFFAISGTVALVMMIGAGVFSELGQKLAILCVLPYFAGIHAGSRRFRKSGAESYRTTALVFLGSVALFGLLWPH